MSWREGLSNTWMGRIMRGIVKLALATLIITLLNNVPIDLTSATIGGSTYNLQVLVDVIKVFAPVALILSALADFGVRL